MTAQIDLTNAEVENLVASLHQKASRRLNLPMHRSPASFA